MADANFNKLTDLIQAKKKTEKEIEFDIHKK